MFYSDNKLVQEFIEALVNELKELNLEIESNNTSCEEIYCDM